MVVDDVMTSKKVSTKYRPKKATQSRKSKTFEQSRKDTSLGSIPGGAVPTKKALLFLIRFFALFFVLTYIVEVLPLASLTHSIATIVAAPFHFFVIANKISVGVQTFSVDNACTGLLSASILASVIFGLRKPELTKKIFLFMFGIAVLMLVNIPRIMLVLYAASMGFDAEAVHMITWFVMSGVILLIWYYGTLQITRIKEFSELV